MWPLIIICTTIIISICIIAQSMKEIFESIYGGCDEISSLKEKSLELEERMEEIENYLKEDNEED